eukprot:77681-Amphidinium_carterae.1
MEALGSSTREADCFLKRTHTHTILVDGLWLGAEKVADEMLDEILTVHPDEKSKDTCKVMASTTSPHSQRGALRCSSIDDT